MENVDQKEIFFKTAWVVYTSIGTPANYSLIMGVILHLCRHYTGGMKWYNFVSIELN